MKITLISPYRVLQAFGLRTISSCLKEEGHDVQMICLNRQYGLYTKRYDKPYSDKVLSEIVRMSEGSNLIGISLSTNYFENAVQITQALKKHCDVKIIWGGIHPTVCPEECLNYADMVCIGEGEGSIVELANRADAGKDVRNIRGIWFANGGKIIKNPMYPLIENLDDIPYMDYDHKTMFALDVENHLVQVTKKQITPMNYTTMPTRGCMFSCAFCCNNYYNKMYNKQSFYRKRSINNIINELLIVKEMPSIDCITFDDDAFFGLPLKEIKEFCRKYKARIGMPLSITGATPVTITREKLSLLTDAGLVSMRMGIQTGSNRIKKLYNLRHTNQQIINAVKIINEYRDKIKRVQYDIILDDLWETDKDKVETLMFLTRLPMPYRLSLCSLVCYPGTELHKKAIKEGLITDELNEVYRKGLHSCEDDTYLSGLFFLVDYCAKHGVRIPSWLMFILTRKTLKWLGLKSMIYKIASSALKKRCVKLKNVVTFTRHLEDCDMTAEGIDDCMIDVGMV